MSKEKLGLGPAFPCEVGFEKGVMMQTSQNGNSTALVSGISTRLYLAGMAMQGILSNSNIFTVEPSNVASRAFEFADYLLIEEDL